MMLVETAAGLYCPAGDFHIDPWQPVDRAVITHAHGDHARPGSAAYLCADPSAPLLRRRFGADARIESVAVRPGAHARRRARQLPSGRPRPGLRAGARRRRRRRVGRSAATTSAPPIRRARRSSRCAATRSSPSRPSACRSTAGIRPATVIDEIVAWWDANRRRRADVGALLLHARQGAAGARRADARHRSARLRARHDARR